MATAKESLLRPFIAIWATDPDSLEGAFDFMDQVWAGVEAAAASGVPGQYGVVRIVSSYEESQAALTPQTQELSPLVSNLSPVMETSDPTLEGNQQGTGRSSTPNKEGTDQ